MRFCATVDRAIANTYTFRIILTSHTYAMAAASAVSSAPVRSSAPLASFATSASGEKEVSGQPRPSLTIAHPQPKCDGFDAAFKGSAKQTRSTKRGLDALFLGSACQVPTAPTAGSNAEAYNAGTYGPKPDATRLQAHKRSREEAEHEALALPKPRRAKKDQEPLSLCIRQPLAEWPNPPAATPVITRPSGWPRITPNDALSVSPGSGFWDENGASVPRVSTTLPKGNALDAVLPLPLSSVGELPRPALRAQDLSRSDGDFMRFMVGWSQSGLSSSPQDGTSLAVDPPVSEHIPASPAPAAPLASGAAAATELLRSGIGALFGAAAISAPEAGDPIDLGSVVPAPGEAPGVIGTFGEGPVTDSWPTQEDIDGFAKDLSMEPFFETPGLEMQAHTGQQAAEQQPQQSEQLQESIWASQPAEYVVQQQAPQNLSAQLPQQAGDFQPLPLTGQQGQDQGQQMPFFPATALPQQPAPGHPYAMPQQQQPPWFNRFLTAPENALNAPFPPERDGNGYTPTFSTWADENYPWDIYVLTMIYGQWFWRSVWSGLYRLAGPVQIPPPPPPPPQPRRGPRGGILRGVGQPGVKASAPVNLGSAPVSLNPGVPSAQGNGRPAAGSGSPAPVMTQEQPSEGTLVDPALLASRASPGEEVFQPMMSGALQ